MIIKLMRLPFSKKKFFTSHSFYQEISHNSLKRIKSFYHFYIVDTDILNLDKISIIVETLINSFDDQRIIESVSSHQTKNVEVSLIKCAQFGKSLFKIAQIFHFLISHKVRRRVPIEFVFIR